MLFTARSEQCLTVIGEVREILDPCTLTVRAGSRIIIGTAFSSADKSRRASRPEIGQTDPVERVPRVWDIRGNLNVSPNRGNGPRVWHVELPAFVVRGRGKIGVVLAAKMNAPNGSNRSVSNEIITTVLLSLYFEIEIILNFHQHRGRDWPNENYRQ